MNKIVEMLCWTLVHSLWQGLILFLLLRAVLNQIPPGRAVLRYNISILTFAFLFATGIVTFCFLLLKTSGSIIPDFQISENQAPLAIITDTPVIGFNFVENFSLFIHQYQHWIFYAWIAGVLIFMIRYLMGIIYIEQLRCISKPVDDIWIEKVQSFAISLGIDKIVRLAEASKISVPMVVGFFKPMILVPIGLLSHLTAEQVECVFLHELAHVKRNDFLINLLQSAVEAVLFFNPFVWIISAQIRVEREHCCDDLAVKHIISPVCYARVLASLEESRNLGYIPAPAMGKSKHELFNRINRIMEKSVKNRTSKEKFLPLMALLVAGLVCAAWINFNPMPKPDDGKQTDSVTLHAPDTTIRNKKEKSATYSRKSVTVYDQNGQPHEEITENFEGDEELKDLMTTPAYPDKFFMPGFPVIDESVFASGFPLSGDTLPNLNAWDYQNWQAFGEVFEKEFKSRFGDFYKDHSAELEKMMKDLAGKFNERDWQSSIEKSMRMQDDQMRTAMQALKQLDQLNFQEQMKSSQQALQMMEEKLRQLDLDQVAKMKQLQSIQADKLRKMEETMKQHGEVMKNFETDLKNQLQKDGYIDGDEKIKNMIWDENGSIEINGKKIKDADKQKYIDLHRKYFRNGGRFSYVE